MKGAFFMEKYIVFDIDGTLNQTEKYAFLAYQEAFQKYDIKNITQKEIKNFIGCTPQQIAEQFFQNYSEETITLWLKEIEEYEEKYMNLYAQPFPEIKEVLLQLKKEGYKLAVCSNANQIHIGKVLKAIHLYDYFDEYQSVLQGFNKAESLKHLIKRIQADKICMVGDRKFDIDAARQNHIFFIGCKYGYAPEEIKQANIIVSSPSAIYDAVKQLIG